MIKPHNLLEEFISVYPCSRDVLIDSADDWIDEKGRISPHALFRVLSEFIITRFQASEYDNAELLFSIIDKCILQGSVSVSNAACTCIIENLVNTASNSDDFERAHFESLLGSEAKKYLEKLDQFYN